MRRLLGLIMACAAVAPWPAQAASRTALVITGSRTASMVLTLRQPVTLSNGDPDAGEASASASISGTADLSGYLIADPSGRRVLAGVVTTSRVQPWGAPARFQIGASTVRLAAGRYLLTLVASAPTEVRIPAAGLRADAVYRPKTPVAVKVSDVPLDPEIGRAARGSTSITVGSRTVTLYGIALRSTGTGGQMEVTITSRHEGIGHGSFYAPIPLPELDEYHAFAGILVPGDLGPDRYDVDWSVEIEGLHREPRGLAVTIG